MAGVGSIHAPAEGLLLSFGLNNDLDQHGTKFGFNKRAFGSLFGMSPA
jgi:hypothetical protein